MTTLKLRTCAHQIIFKKDRRQAREWGGDICSSHNWQRSKSKSCEAVLLIKIDKHAYSMNEAFKYADNPPLYAG